MESCHEIISELPRYQGDICRELTVSSGTEYGSVPIRIPGNGVFLVIAALSEFRLKPGQFIRSACYGAYSRSGTFRKMTMHQSVTGPKYIQQGEEICRFFLDPSAAPWQKLNVTASAEFPAASVTIYLSGRE